MFTRLLVCFQGGRGAAGSIGARGAKGAQVIEGPVLIFKCESLPRGHLLIYITSADATFRLFFLLFSLFLGRRGNSRFPRRDGTSWRKGVKNDVCKLYRKLKCTR